MAAIHKVWRQLLAVGGIRVGDTDDYTDFARLGQTSPGRQTMAGKARVYRDIWLPASMWYGIEPDQFANAFNATATAATCTPTVQPFSVYSGEAAASAIQVPVISASVAENLAARAATVFFAPPDAATTGSIECKLYYTTKVEMATAGSMQVWRLHYNYMGSRARNTGGCSGSILYGASMATTGSGALEVHDLGDIPPFNVSSSPFVVLQLTLEGADASSMAGSPEEAIFGLKLRYVADSLGVTT